MPTGITNAACVIKDVNISIRDDTALVMAAIDVCSDYACFENRLLTRTLPGAKKPVVRREIMSNYYVGRHTACLLDDENQVSWHTSNNIFDYPLITITITMLLIALPFAGAFGLVGFSLFNLNP